MHGDPTQRRSCRFVTGQEVEGGPGEVDRSILSIELHLLERGVMQRNIEAAPDCRCSASFEHVERGVETFDLQSPCPQIKEWIAVAAAEFKGRFTRPLDELRVGLGLERFGAEMPVQLCHALAE